MTSRRANPGECFIVLDGWRPDLEHWLWSASDAEGLRAAFHDLASVLASLVDRPDKTTLVFAVDFAEAVMRRDPSRPYSTTRGSGMVGGRTMPRDDGTVDVLIDANWLVGVDGEGRLSLKPVGVELMARSVKHEAQHAIMHQRGSGFEAYGRDKVSGFINVHMFDAASIALDEHRAEWGAIAISTKKYPTRSSAETVLAALGSQLAAADAAYQQSLDVLALLKRVLQTCSPFWVELAYWTAQYRSADSMEAPSLEVTSLPLWERFVGDSWPQIANAFHNVPVADLTTSSSVLHHAALTMAAALRLSLKQIGFYYTDDSNGSSFHIGRHDFLG